MESKQTTVAIIGCGTIGSALLEGLLRASREEVGKCTKDDLRFVATVKTETSAERLRAQFAADANRVTFYVEKNLDAMYEADIIVFAFPPREMNSILQTSRSDNDDKCVYNAIEDKVVISMLPKRSAGKIQCNDVPVPKYRRDDYKPACFIRAVPNSAVRVCQSMTVIDTEVDTEGIPTRQFSSATWLFEKVGKVKLVPLEQFDASVMLAGGSMTMMALPLKGVLDGAVALGLTKRDVLSFSAQMLKGMAELLEDGTSPAELSESMPNQWNYMTRKLWDLEKKGIRVAFAEAMTD